MLLVGHHVGGFLGLLLAVPIASTLKSLGAEYLLPEIRRLAAARAVGPGPPGGTNGPEAVPAAQATTSVDSAGAPLPSREL